MPLFKTNIMEIKITGKDDAILQLHKELELRCKAHNLKLILVKSKKSKNGKIRKDK